MIAMASVFTNCFVPKSSIPVLPCNKAMHFNTLVVTRTHSRPRCPFPKQSLVAPNYKHLNVAAKNKEDQWRLWCSYDGFNSAASFELQVLIANFFYGIEQGDEILLNRVLSSDCEFQDIFFNIQPGKQNMIAFLLEVKKAMGGNIHFNVELEPVDETYNMAARVHWHLEWNGYEIPFTRSSSLFDCEEGDDGELLIRSIIGGVKPGEPGKSILKILKAARPIFDEFRPQEAEVKNEEDQRSSSGGFNLSSQFAELIILITKFFNYGIKQGNEILLKEILSSDCEFHDVVFNIQPGGRENMIAFLREVKEAIGGYIHFEIKLAEPGDATDISMTARVHCHLEWEGHEIPFTRSSYLFECEEDEVDYDNRKLLIRKITGVKPGEPGKSILKFLKAACIIFDTFPQEAEKFLLKTNQN